MTKKELWEYEFDRPQIKTREFRRAECCLCSAIRDERDMKAFQRLENDPVKYICKECFIK